jgi:hypothetical protein
MELEAQYPVLHHPVLHLASNACCDISFCGQCGVIHFRIGRVSLQLPPEVFENVCAAAAVAAGRFQDCLANPHHSLSAAAE